MLYRDAIRAIDALIGEIEAAGEGQKKTGWMSQAWHRRLTWARWLREVRSYVEDKETMALARIVEIDQLKIDLDESQIQLAQAEVTIERLKAQREELSKAVDGVIVIDRTKAIKSVGSN